MCTLPSGQWTARGVQCEHPARPMARAGNYTVSTRLAGRIVDTAARLGASPEAIYERAGVAPETMDDGDARIDEKRYAALWIAAVDATKRRALPILVATDPNAITNVLQYVAKTAEDLLEALSVCARYLRVLTSASQWIVRHDGDAVVVSITHPDPDLVSIYSDEFAIAEIVTRGRAFSGVAWKANEIRFAHAAPDDTREARELFQCRLRYGAAATEIVLGPAVTSLPLLKADKGMKSFFEKHLEELLAKHATKNDAEIVHRAREALASALRGDAPTLETLAKKLGLGSRTLRRRLADEGTTFSDLLDDHRRSLAKSYLENDMSIAEVAYLLGFKQPSAFHRAFKRWFGSTPERFRQNLEKG